MDTIIDSLKRERNELYGINDTLIKSNKLYEQKWRQFYHAYEIYKQFYINYKDKINLNQSATYSIPYNFGY